MVAVQEANLEEVQKKIIYESINQVLCIDDKFSGPYATGDEINNTEKDIFEALTKEGNCMVSMVQYTNGINFKEIMNKKDLLILDWELGGVTGGCEEALEILYQAVLSDIPFLCIYTNERDCQLIYNTIEDYFSKYTREEVEEFYSEVEDDELFDFELIKEKVKDFINLEDEEKRNYKTNLFNLMSIPSEKRRLPLFNMDSLEKLSLFLNNRYKRANGYGKDISVTNLPNKKSRQALNINGKILTVFQKTEELGLERSIAPKDLIKEYTNCFLLHPNSIFNLIGLRYKNTFKRLIYKQGRALRHISDEAFFYHYRQLQLEDDHIDENLYFQDFLNNLYQGEVGNILNSGYEKIEDCILKELSEQCKSMKTQNNEEELLKINYYYSVNEMAKDNSRKVAFGDIFYNFDGTYAICITPHCQCLRPQKIDYDYLFLFGKLEETSRSALEKPESDGNYFSYIKREREYKAIRWDIKLKMLYLSDSENTIKKDAAMNAIYHGNNYQLQYICQMKENYVQRLANHSIKEANKVGIIFAKKIDGQSISRRDIKFNQAQKEVAITLE